MILIFKKGDHRQCDNYRDISVLATIGRLYRKIIRNRIEEGSGKIEEDQAGFTAGRSCIDQIYTLQQLLQKKKAKNRTLHLAVIDIRKACDSVPVESNARYRSR